MKSADEGDRPAIVGGIVLSVSKGPTEQAVPASQDGKLFDVWKLFFFLFRSPIYLHYIPLAACCVRVSSDEIF